MLSAFITGLAGPELTAREADVLRAAGPCGVILFARNAVDPQQVRRLTDAATAAVGEEILVLIDQEGGRVQRLRPPHWRALPAAAGYAKAYAGDPRRAVCRQRHDGIVQPVVPVHDRVRAVFRRDRKSVV